MGSGPSILANDGAGYSSKGAGATGSGIGVSAQLNNRTPTEVTRPGSQRDRSELPYNPPTVVVALSYAPRKTLAKARNHC